MLAAARAETGMPIITEVMDARDLETVCEYADILQIGTRNAQNYTLLREVGSCRTPVMLKRGMSSKIEEWLQAAEYIASQGNYDIMLCERGIRTFETYTRNTFDINAFPALKELTHLPVIADPSHGTGKASLVPAVTKAAVVAGADGCDRRSASAPRKGAQRRRAIADPGRFRRADGGPAPHRAGRRPQRVARLAVIEGGGGGFRRVAIVGVGLIGGSLGMALRARGWARSVVGVGRDAERLANARRLGAVDEVALDLAEGVVGADLVVLATPIFQVLADLPRLVPHLAPGAVVTDVGSTKAEIARAGDAHLPAGAFVPGHPMAGSERSGVEAADPDLFEGAVWALTPTESTDPGALARVRALAEAVGARARTLSPDEHDRAVAITSHLPHVLAYALSALAAAEAEQNPSLYALAAGSFASATRVAASPPELWRDVALTNREALAAALRAYRADLDRVLAALGSGDADTLRARFEAGYAAAKGRASDG
jgi:prephenate dehydrogenase